LILDDIAEAKRLEVEAKKRAGRAIGGHQPAPDSRFQARDFVSSVRRAGEDLPRVIAEVKRASPSRGVIREDFDPVSIARAYESAGASALSVLTDERFFQGHIDHLRACRNAVRLPVLRKDFVIDPYQIHEARAAGADAVLLIAALLDTDALREFRREAEGLGMAALVEAHDERELESALESGAHIVGINNRDLQTFQVDVETTFRLVSMIPRERIIVSESGIGTRDDLKRLADAGVDAALIGETLLSAPDPGAKLRELIGK